MEYRGVEYTVVQGIERGDWKWSASVAGVVIMGQAAIKSEAVAAAEKAIDRALALKKVRLCPARKRRLTAAVAKAVSAPQGCRADVPLRPSASERRFRGLTFVQARFPVSCLNPRCCVELTYA